MPSGNSDTYATELNGTITLWQPFFQENSTYQSQVLLHELIHKAGAGYFNDIQIAQNYGWSYNNSLSSGENISLASAHWNATFLSNCQ